MKEILTLINEMAPYLLLGFLLAGIMHAFIPQRYYNKFLGGDNFKSVLYATIFGIPLPLCSCGVIPTAMSLRREGASRGATTAFLIATPQTGVDSIIATYSLLGLPFAIIRPVVALITALFGGCMVNSFGTDNHSASKSERGYFTTSSNATSIWAKLKEAIQYAFVDMMQDIGKWLVIGLIVAGLITVFVPESFFATFTDNSLLSMFIVLLFAIPMYLCATGSIPIAVALMLKGLSPGAALVLLMAGPAANMASILVINKVMGRRNLILYLISIIGGAIIFGLGIDYLLPREWFTSSIMAIQESCHGSVASWRDYIATIALSLLLINALRLRYTKHECCNCHKESSLNNNNMVNITIKGMNCNHCKNSVEKAILALPNVESVTIDLASGQTSIVGNPSYASLVQAIESVGFSVLETNNATN